MTVRIGIMISGDVYFINLIIIIIVIRECHDGVMPNFVLDVPNAHAQRPTRIIVAIVSNGFVVGVLNLDIGQTTDC